MPEDTKFDDESFDISEIEGSVETGPVFLHDGTKIKPYRFVRRGFK